MIRRPPRSTLVERRRQRQMCIRDRVGLFRRLAGAYIYLMRGTPLMLQIMFIYYGLPLMLNIQINDFPAAILAFVANYAAYFAEIFRGGIQSISKGQYEGAKVLGFTYKQTMWHIILPQVIKRVIPPLGNETITLLKDTSLVYILAMNDLMRVTRAFVQRDFDTTPVSYTHLTLPTTLHECRSRWSPYH